VQVIALLEAGAAVNIVDEYGWSLLHMAAARGHQEILEALILAGGDLEAVDASHRTVLHEAADQGHTTIVEVLLTAGADIEKTDQMMRTALHGAADDGHEAVVSNRLPSVRSLIPDTNARIMILKLPNSLGNAGRCNTCEHKY
jgi:ankyrin repeat protein